MEQVDDQVHKVEEHPTPALHPFDMVGRHPGGIHGADNSIGNPADVCIRRAGRNDEVIGGIAQATQVDHLKLDTLAVIDGVHRQSQCGREPAGMVVNHGHNHG